VALLLNILCIYTYTNRRLQHLTEMLYRMIKKSREAEYFSWIQQSHIWSRKSALPVGLNLHYRRHKLQQLDPL